MSDRRIPDLPEYDEYSLASLLQEYARKAAARNAAAMPEPITPAAPTKPAPQPEADAAEDTVQYVPVQKKRRPDEAEHTMQYVPVQKKNSPADAQNAGQKKTGESAAQEPLSAEQIAERSRQAVMSSLGKTLREYREKHPAPSDAEQKDEQKPEPEPMPEPDPAPSDIRKETQPQEKDAPAAVRAARPTEAPRHPRVIVGDDGIITLRYDEPAAEETAPPEDDAAPPEPEQPRETEKPRSTHRKHKAPPSDAAAADMDIQTAEDRPEAPSEGFRSRIGDISQSFRDRILAPAIRYAAKRIALRQLQKTEAENWPEPVEIRETPELTPGKASKFYSSLLKTLTLRFRISLILTAILVWISLRLPMAGMLRYSLPMQAGVSLLLLLAVMMAALDAVTTGFRQLFELKPGAESLAAVSCVLACVDALCVFLGEGEALPFCAIGAASLTTALWGELLTCRALRRTFRTAAASKAPSCLAVGGEEASLMRSDREDIEGIVRRSESQDLCRTVYAAAAPYLFGAALLLSIIARFSGRDTSFLHTLSALVSVSASFAVYIGFPLPYAIASRSLRNAGAALAGYAGCANIGTSRRLIIRDEDLFPPGTMRFTEINVSEGVFVGKVVSAAASLLSASGSGVSGLFDDLMTRRGYNRPKVEEFTIHEGGGLSGIIEGERVLVGSAGFMNLMGIRLPQNLPTRNAVCCAVSGELEGVFVIEYIPTTSVQEALVTIMRSKMKAVFAIRDFNITPRMIGKLFRLPTDNFNFPSFRERYRILEESADEAPVDAVISRPGMLPLVEAAEAARKAYSNCRLTAILSLVGAGIGMVIMFLLCRVGSFDTASAGNVLSFMVLWSLPSLILSLGQNR